jgi:two-component system LytT family response regulator
MKKYKALVVDDETQARNALRDLIETDFPQIEIIAEADGVDTAIQAIDSNNPSIVFLDINLGDGSGFDVLERLSKKDFFLIFTTAYDQYAISAFKQNAIDYLLKPILSEDLKFAMEKIAQQTSSIDLTMQVEMLKEMMTEPGRLRKADKKIVLKDQDTIHFIKTQDIIYCKSDGPYTEFYIQPNQKIFVSQSLKDYEDLLEPYHFIRVHHSYLVNKDMIIKYIKGNGGSLLLQGNFEIPVSQRRKEMVLAQLTLE